MPILPMRDEGMRVGAPGWARQESCTARGVPWVENILGNALAGRRGQQA